MISILKKKLLFIFAFITLTSCEVFKIGGKTTILPSKDQFSALGVSLLFYQYAALDSNSKSACELLSDSLGKPLLARDRILLRPTFEKFQTIFQSQNITNYKLDTLTDNKVNVELEINYIQLVKLTALAPALNETQQKQWFISTSSELFSKLNAQR